MKYKIVKENKPTLKTFGKYKAVASHHRIVSNTEIVKEVCEQHPYDESLVNAVIREAYVLHFYKHRLFLPDCG